MGGAQGRNRTTDTEIFSLLLYRLSYLGKPEETDGRRAGTDSGRVAFTRAGEGGQPRLGA
jgi:hypothetical protein